VYAGHLGIALGASAARARIPLAWFVAAALLCDLSSVGLGLLGIRDAGIVYSHGLPQVVVTGALIGACVWRRYGDAIAGLAVGATVLSHLPADYVTSTKVAMWTGGPQIGLRVYQHPVADFVVEGALVTAGWVLYRRATRGGTRRAWAQWAMLGALIAFQGWFCTLGIT
jgi:hypothetical protein